MRTMRIGGTLRTILCFLLVLAGASVFSIMHSAQAQELAYVSNYVGGTVSVIDTITNTVVATLGAAPNPLGVAVNPAGTRIYVANASANRLSVIDPATNTLVATVGVGINPHGVAINPEGTRVYVVNNGSNTVSVIDTATDSVVATVGVGNYPQLGIAINPKGTRLYIANSRSNDVSVIDTATNTAVASIPAGVNPLHVAINPAGTRVYVTADHSNDVSVIDTATNTVVATVGVGVAPQGVSVHPSGARVYVANPGSNDVSVIDAVSNMVVATVGVGDQPAGVAINSAGTRVYVANHVSNNVSVIETATHTVVATVPVGTRPVTIAFAPQLPNRAPVAMCKDVSVSASSSCSADVSVDNGSFDPDGDPITVSQSPPGPYGLGNTTVTLTVTDDNGASTQCSAVVTVVDNQPPQIACPGDTTVTSALGATTAVVSYSSPTATDNCSSPSVVCVPLSGSSFPLGATTVNCASSDGAGNTAACSFVVRVVPPQLTALNPAGFWIGLKNSDDVGTKFDLLAEVLKNGATVGSGQLNNVAGGSSGFNNAVRRVISLALAAAVDCAPGDTLSIRLSARIAVGVPGHRSGTARLWFNDAAADSHFDATIGGANRSYYLSSGFVLSPTPGPGPKNTSDVFVDQAAAGNPFRPFGTWSVTF